jgi:hypothetical protein
MIGNADDARCVVQRLLESDEDQLLEQLGIRSEAIQREPSKADSLDPSISNSEIATMGAKEALRTIGERVLNRWNREAYVFICGADQETQKERSDLKRAFGLGDAAAAGALTSALLLIPSMPLALAPVIAVILIKRFFGPAMDEFCGYWNEALQQQK